MSTNREKDWIASAKAQQELNKKIRQMDSSEDKGSNEPTYSSTAPKTTSEPNKDDNPEDESSTPEAVSLLPKIILKGLMENKNDIEEQQKDPTSPLYSAKTFQGLNLKPTLLKGVNLMGFNAPSRIQGTALPIILAYPPQNVIAQSQSGTGKTAAFVLAMLSRVNTDLDYPHILCLTPNSDLAIQTAEVVIKIGQFMKDLKIKLAVRGEKVPRGTKIRDHILIGTPRKVVDWSIKFNFFKLSKITVFVLDEADMMIATKKYFDQTFKLLRLLPEYCQMLFFSTTYEQEVMELVEVMVPNSNLILLRREEESLDNIKQYYLMCRNADEKYSAIANIYGAITIGQAIIFCKNKKMANWLSKEMIKDGHAVALLFGDLNILERIAILDGFRQGLQKVLITTNRFCRGIDVEQVTLVVNFNLPVDFDGLADCETYLHRIGRAGRFGKNGIAINLVIGEQEMFILKKIESHFGKKINLLNVDEIEKLSN